jgi:RNA polymerase sigma factor (sigma-70 family)
MAADTAQLVKAQAGDQEALERLLQANRGLVHKLAFDCWQRSDAHSRMELGDLLQEGRIGLWQAIHSFDPERGAFGTHAAWAIRGRLSHALKRRAGDPEADSLDEFATEDGSLLVDLIPDDAPGPEETVLERIDGPAMAAVRMLAPALRQVIEARFGLCGREPMSLKEVGTALGLHPHAVAYREAKALRVLRARLERDVTPTQARMPTGTAERCAAAARQPRCHSALPPDTVPPTRPARTGWSRDAASSARPSAPAVRPSRAEPE